MATAAQGSPSRSFDMSVDDQAGAAPETQSRSPAAAAPAWDDPSNPANPKNWSFWRKVLITGIWIYGNLVASISSSMFSSGADAISREFKASTETVTLGVSLFVAGYAVGSPVWSPLSERFGRRWPLLAGLALFTVFCVPVAVGTTLRTVLAGRFLCGVAGVAPIALFGGGLVDIWHPEQRAVAMATCIGVVLGGPLLAPVLGGFITASHLGWRWTAWLSCIMGASCLLLAFFGLPETYAPVLLQRGAPQAEGSAESSPPQRGGGLKRFVRVYLVRPFVLLGTEPILVLVTIYQAFVYGMLYLVFSSYPIIFRQERHWELGLSSLPYLGMMAGVLLGSGAIVARTQMAALKASRRDRDSDSDSPPAAAVVPERRLPLMMVGSVLLPVGLFVFGWTSAPGIPWPGMVVASLPVGIGLIMIFVQCMNYILDVYSGVANSAMGANTIVRSSFAAGFPLFAAYMYDDLGVEWASSVLGFVSLAMIPIPILFYKYGPRIRLRARYTVSA